MFHLFCNFVSQMTRITQTAIVRHYCECEGTTCSHVIPLNDIKRFVADCLLSLGAKESNAEIVADAMVQADYRGVVSHGVSRLGSNQFGMGSLYTYQAAKKGYIGLSFSNGIPEMVPPGGLEVALGENPLSIAAPAHSEALVVDMATTAVTPSKIKQYDDLKIKLPKGWALNKQGQIEDIPERALKLKMLSPLGGDQNHKGFGLALLVEVLSGLLADSNCGPTIPIPKDNSKKVPLNLGHSFIAINPEKFVPNFATRLTKLLNQLRNMESVDPKKPILVPGERERVHMNKVDCAGGICYGKSQLDALENLSQNLGVRPLQLSLYTQVQQNKKKGGIEWDIF